MLRPHSDDDSGSLLNPPGARSQRPSSSDPTMAPGAPAIIMPPPRNLTRGPRPLFVVAGAALLAGALAVALGLTARGSGSSSSSSPPNGPCKRDMPPSFTRLPNWDGRQIPACDPSLCNALLPEQTAPLPATRGLFRWSDAQEAAYNEAVSSNPPKIEGWLEREQVAYVKAFSALQHELGAYGTVAEIGVHHGKFFAPLVGYSHPSEKALALDLFETNQAMNVDFAGSGSVTAVSRTLTDVTGIPRDQYTLMPGNSLHLSARNFSGSGSGGGAAQAGAGGEGVSVPAFRMFSVDGGHTLETVLHDFNVAACGLRQGGIIILDDWLNGPWIGATEAVVLIAHAYSDLVPFFHGRNKIWFTTRSHAARYRAHADAHFSCTKFHPSRAALAGFEMCLPEK